jgi:tRNA pseudouridine38-40 synthase
MAYKLTVEYDGTDFFGFQMQKDGKRTVQKVLQEVLLKFFNEDIKITYASRTDRGVHADGQVVGFSTKRQEEPLELRNRLNMLLPDDVKISKVEMAPEGFDAGRNIESKKYRYEICNADYLMPMFRHTSLFVYQQLDVEKMQQAASILQGTYDFTSFCSAECEKEDKVRTIFEIAVIKMQDRTIWIEIEGNGFLQHMVRIIVGTLIEVGKGKLSSQDVKNILEKKDRRHKGKTESPRGLTLVNVKYFKKS